MKHYIQSVLLALISLLSLLALGLGVLAWAPPALAETGSNELVLGFGSWSYHNDRTKDYNETNEFVGVGAGDYNLAYYKNSDYGDTVVFTKDFMWETLPNLDVGFMTGVATGYTSGGEPILAAMFKASYRIGNWGVDYRVLPSTVQHINFKYYLGRSVSSYEPDKDKRWAIGYGYGLGGTAELTYSLSDKWSVRAKLTNGKFDWDDSHQFEHASSWQTEYVHLSNYGVMLDYHPWAGNFTVYGGLLGNLTEYETLYRIYTPYGACGVVDKFGGRSTLCQGDSLRGVVGWDKASLAAGVRWGNPFKHDAWSMFIDVGVHTLTGIDAEASYEGRGEVSEANLNAWEDYELNKYDNKFPLMPVVSVGFQF